MKLFKKELSLTQHYTVQYIMNGVFWLLYSIFDLPDNKPLNIIGACFLTLGCICSLITLFKKYEPDDEMSLEHIQHAKAISFDIIMSGIMVLGIIAITVKSMPTFEQLYGFIFAASQILPGLLFLHYEKEGY